jgi:MSHA biogenesis protein MshQ
MSAWVNFGYVGGGSFPGIISKRKGLNYYTAYALFLGDQDKVWVDVEYENDRFASTAAFESDRWYHVAVVYDGSAQAAERVHLYVDGALDTVAPETSSEISAFTSDLEVGRLVNGGSTMIGMIDEVAVWRRALGPDEVARLASAPVQ